MCASNTNDHVILIDRPASAFAQRAADGARKALGPEHPDTKKYERLLDELLAKRFELDRA